MTINFYVNKDDLDHLYDLIKHINPVDMYQIVAYRSEMELIAQSGTDNFLNRYFLIGISYEDFMRVEEYLIF